MFNFWILGINARNLHYIGKHNPAKAVRLADNKITTKNFLTQRGIPVPGTYAVIKNRSELAAFDFFSIPHTYFIIKPARGSRGRWIFRVKKNNTEETFTVQWKEISESLLKTYCYDILDGKESLQWKPDHILIEELMVAWDDFAPYCEWWLADIRIIVYNFVPVAAMLRVPTESSWWKANLDRWWVGLWVEVWSWKIQSMYLHWKTYKTEFPEPYTDFLGKKLSYRDDILTRSAQIQYYVNLWYLALDRVITDTWPKLLEINARAWLKIQLALDMPLRERLEKVGDLRVSSPEKWVEICQTLFSQQKRDIVSANKILPQHSYGTIASTIWVQHEATIDIDLNKSGVIMDPLLADEFEEAKTCTVHFSHEWVSLPIQTRRRSNSLSSHHIILWQDVVSGYLIKPVPPISATVQLFRRGIVLSQEIDLLRALDNKLAEINGKLILSRYLKPQNFLEQLDIFLAKDGDYNPEFTYQRPTVKKLTQIGTELAYIRDEFWWLQTIESPLGVLFAEKIDELVLKQQMLLAYRAQDLERVFELQSRYWGAFDEKLLQEAHDRVSSAENDRKDLWPVLWRKRIMKEVVPYLIAQWWWEVEVKFTPETFARMSVKKYGSRLILQISSGSTFRKHDLFAALAHELMHLRRYSNGASTWRNIFKRWTSRYFIDEEGLAIWAAEQELPDSYEKISMWKKYLLVDQAMHYDFADLVDILRAESTNKSLLSLFKTAYRLKRWIESTDIVSPFAVSLQDTIYAQWYHRIEQWVENWGRLNDLYMGKIKLEDIQYLA